MYNLHESKSPNFMPTPDVKYKPLMILELTDYLEYRI